MTFAIVNVFPVPVAPNSTCSFFPSLIPSTNSLIASGWSPDGLNFDTSLNIFFLPSYYYTHLYLYQYFQYF